MYEAQRAATVKVEKPAGQAEAGGDCPAPGKSNNAADFDANVTPYVQVVAKAKIGRVYGVTRSRAVIGMR